MDVPRRASSVQLLGFSGTVEESTSHFEVLVPLLSLRYGTILWYGIRGLFVLNTCPKDNDNANVKSSPCLRRQKTLAIFRATLLLSLVREKKNWRTQVGLIFTCLNIAVSGKHSRGKRKDEQGAKIVPLS